MFYSSSDDKDSNWTVTHEYPNRKAYLWNSKNNNKVAKLKTVSIQDNLRKYDILMKGVSYDKLSPYMRDGPQFFIMMSEEGGIKISDFKIKKQFEIRDEKRPGVKFEHV